MPSSMRNTELREQWSCRIRLEHEDAALAVMGDRKQGGVGTARIEKDPVTHEPFLLLVGTFEGVHASVAILRGIDNLGAPPLPPVREPDRPAETNVVSETPPTDPAPEPVAPPADVMTARDVTAYLKIGRTKLYELTKRGDLPASRIGGDLRFLRSDVVAFVEGSRVARP